MENKMKRFKWRLVDERGRTKSRHFTKKQCQMAQLRSGKAKRYVRKY